ncbi:MAG TPA: CmcI family methyltransferase, partial [Pyrinomonadaceae bacterium]|nr:CmcI family methyltransferase [Pyrinomonadaceae bacterium]
MIKVDIEQGTVSVEEGDRITTHRLDTAEAFKIISDVWLRAGWDNKYVYSFTWLGRPIIQLPEDMFRLQELIHSLRPDVIVET